MKTQAAHDEPVPVAQNCRCDARIGDGDAAQTLRKARERIQDHAVVVAMCVALHHHPARKSEMIEQREIFFRRRFWWRVTAAFRERKILSGTENMRVCVPCAGRQLNARLVRISDGGRNRWRYG